VGSVISLDPKKDIDGIRHARPNCGGVTVIEVLANILCRKEEERVQAARQNGIDIFLCDSLCGSSPAGGREHWLGHRDLFLPSLSVGVLSPANSVKGTVVLELKLNLYTVRAAGGDGRKCSVVEEIVRLPKACRRLPEQRPGECIQKRRLTDPILAN
jgi:hypothetical protein